MSYPEIIAYLVLATTVLGNVNRLLREARASVRAAVALYATVRRIAAGKRPKPSKGQGNPPASSTPRSV